MYTPPAFRLTDDASRTFIEQRGFGVLVASEGDRYETTPLPLILDGDRLIGHVAKANPIWKMAGSVAVVFTGEDGYISPAWYATKAETGKVVPTWNYVAVTANATMTAVHDAERKLDIVRALTNHHEDIAGTGWEIEDAPADYIESMLNAIVGIELVVVSLTGKAKLSQNRPEADRAGVRAALTGTPLGDLMSSD